MAPEWKLAQTPTAQRAWEEILRPLAKSLRNEAPALARESVQRTLALIPETLPEPTSAEQVRLTSVASLGVVA